MDCATFSGVVRSELTSIRSWPSVRSPFLRRLRHGLVIDRFRSRARARASASDRGPRGLDGVAVSVRALGPLSRAGAGWVEPTVRGPVDGASRQRFAAQRAATRPPCGARRRVSSAAPTEPIELSFGLSEPLLRPGPLLFELSSPGGVGAGSCPVCRSELFDRKRFGRADAQRAGKAVGRIPTIRLCSVSVRSGVGAER
jgi:hypothetical protein